MPSLSMFFQQAQQWIFRPVPFSSISQSHSQYLSIDAEHAVTCCASTPILKPQLNDSQMDISHRKRNYICQNYITHPPELNHTVRFHGILRQQNTSTQHDRCPPQLRNNKKRDVSSLHHQFYPNVFLIIFFIFFLHWHFFSARTVVTNISVSSEQSKDVHSVLHLPVHPILGVLSDTNGPMDAAKQDLQV